MNYILFLHHRYQARDNAFHLDLLRGKTTVAVDGGIRFFRKNKIKPDILIGDFDSAPRLSEKYLESIEVITHPTRKDKTDCHLALELALARGAREIIICGAASETELDHTLGNVMLLELVHRYNKKHDRSAIARLVSPNWTAQLVVNDTITVTGRPDDYLSLIPLSAGCRVDYSGLDYPAPSGRLTVGESLTLRNRFVSRAVRVIIQGHLLVIVSRNRKIA